MIIALVFGASQIATIAWGCVRRHKDGKLLDSEKLKTEGLERENSRLAAECNRLERQSAESDASAQRARAAAESNRIQFNAQQMTLLIVLGLNEHLLDRTEKLEAGWQAEREACQRERQKTESLSNEVNETRKKHNAVVDEAAAFVRALKAAVMLWEMYKDETYKLRALLLKKGAKIEQMQNDAQRAHAAESAALDMLRMAEMWEKGHQSH